MSMTCLKVEVKDKEGKDKENEKKKVKDWKQSGKVRATGHVTMATMVFSGHVTVCLASYCVKLYIYIYIYSFVYSVVWRASYAFNAFVFKVFCYLTCF
jgi:hypothetical protein